MTDHSELDPDELRARVLSGAEPVWLSEFDRNQLRAAALLLAPMVRSPQPSQHEDLAARLADPYALPDDVLVASLTEGWEIVQPRIQEAFDHIRQVAQLVVDSFRTVVGQFMESVDLEVLEGLAEAMEEEDDGATLMVTFGSDEEDQNDG